MGIYAFMIHTKHSTATGRQREVHMGKLENMVYVFHLYNN